MDDIRLRDGGLSLRHSLSLAYRCQSLALGALQPSPSRIFETYFPLNYATALDLSSTSSVDAKTCTKE